MKTQRSTGYQRSSKLKREKNMCQTISLFNKYLLSRPHNNIIGSTNMSLLETKLLPQMRCEGELLSTLTTGDHQVRSCSKDQLTIFYNGAIHVYDHVPLDKAQAIMLLAGESSSSNTPTPKVDTQPPNLQSSIPMARRHSLQSFFEKRHRCNRTLVKKKSSPYASGIDHGSSNNNVIGACKNEEAVSIMPFPSRLGFNVHTSLHKPSENWDQTQIL